MSVTLNLDEMLCAIKEAAPERHFAMQAALEALGSQMALTLANALDCIAHAAVSEIPEFGGTCATFHPARPGQACPEALAKYDRGGVPDWESEASTTAN